MTGRCVAAQAEGRIGPPVLIAASIPLADGLSGDDGLRQILAEPPGARDAVEVTAHPPDIDTPADLERWRELGSRPDRSPHRSPEARIAHMLELAPDR